MKHLQLVLATLKDHKLYAKLSKCRFDVLEDDYLGHVISTDGMIVRR